MKKKMAWLLTTTMTMKTRIKYLLVRTLVWVMDGVVIVLTT